MTDTEGGSGDTAGSVATSSGGDSSAEEGGSGTAAGRFAERVGAPAGLGESLVYVFFFLTVLLIMACMVWL